MSSKWISAKITPKKEDRYLVCNTKGYIYIAEYWCGEWFIQEEMQAGITHWQPLPEPPKQVHK